MPMDAEQYALVKSLFAEVCDLPAPARSERLQALTDNSEVIALVLELLAQSQTRGVQVGAAVQQAMSFIATEELRIGDRLSAWTIIEAIGHGGMGSLYLVERNDGHFQQRAALKVLKGLAHAKSLELLARERQLLASLAHPNIARLLDGGATPAGHPWLVMEFIDGLAIDKYCATQRLNQDAILRLFVQACAAVAFAHRQLIVHCDLKPANLLVNKEGRPILLDFGIAKLIDSSGSVLAISPAYTPGYASPEQRRNEPVSIASDIYSLGVMLAELLKLAAPASRLRGRELAAIIALSSAENPADRYGSVDALTDDIERFLQQKPLRAMPNSARYRGEKLVRRHWRWLLAAVVFLMLISVFSAKLLIESERAQRAEIAALTERKAALAERDRAQQSEASARQISDFLVSIFEYSSVDANTGNVPTATLVAQALARLDTELSGQPGIQAELYAALSRVQRVMGNFVAAQASLRRAITLERTQSRPLTLSAMLQAMAKMQLADVAMKQALPEANEALQLALKYADPASEFLAEAYSVLGQIESALEHRAPAELALKNALRIRQMTDPKGAKAAESLQLLGRHFVAFQDYAAAVDTMQQGLVILKNLSGTDNDGYVGALGSLGAAYLAELKFDEAESTFRAALAIERKLYGDSARVAWSLSQLGNVINNAGRPLDSLAIFDEALEIGAKKFGPQSLSQAVLLNNQATACQHAGKESCAEKAYLASLSILNKLPGSKGTTPRISMNYGLFLMRTGRLTEALPLLQRNYQGIKANPTDRLEYAAEAVQALLECAILTGDLVQAERLAVEFAPLREKLRAADVTTQTRIDALLLARQGEFAPALAASLVAEAQYLKSYGSHDSRYWIVQIDRAELLAAQRDAGAHDQARVLATQIDAELRSRLAPEANAFKRLQRLLLPQ